MTCFSLSWIEGVLIQLVCIIGGVAIARLLIPALFGLLGLPLGGTIQRAVEIIIWVIVAIFAIHVTFDILECLFSGAGMRRY